MEILDAIVQAVDKVKAWTDNKKADKTTVDTLSNTVPNDLAVIDGGLYLVKDGTILSNTEVQLSRLTATDNGDVIITLSTTTSDND